MIELVCKDSFWKNNRILYLCLNLFDKFSDTRALLKDLLNDILFKPVKGQPFVQISQTWRINAINLETIQ